MEESQTRASDRGTTRRTLFRYAVGGAAIVAGLAVLKRVFLPGSLNDDGRAAFAAFLDTLLPQGELPGWRTSGVMPRLVDDLARRRQSRRALVEGVAWLDAQARARFDTRFAALGVDQREVVVAAAEHEPAGTIPHYFYRIVRDRAMELHFAHPAVWRALGLPHPPQPDGYRDFAEAPRA